MFSVFENAKKNFGFGCMRLPVLDGRVDRTAFCRMIDRFMERGFNYFDTARMYHSGDSEVALGECLCARYPRESYFLVDKLTGHYFNTEEEVRPLFEDQLRVLGVDYLDLYLMHAQYAGNYEKYRACRAYEQAFEFKKEGRVRHVGISFHDSAKMLERILTDYPEIEVVQLQLNYLDYDDPVVEGRACYEVCQRYGKPVIVMEPVKGGALVRLSDAASAPLLAHGRGSLASYAIRYAASFPLVGRVLSGMSDDAQMEDNLSFMENFVPFSEEEHALVREVAGIIRREEKIGCTACAYCVDGCPASIEIPRLFALYNAHMRGDDVEEEIAVAKASEGYATACVGCGACEKICPQHLRIRSLLHRVARTFDA